MPTKKTAKNQEQEPSQIIGKKVSAFSLPMTGEKTLKASDLKGQTVVLYFYPKDNTSGCTAEGENFRDEFIKFKKLGVSIYGASRDSLKSHEGFKAKFRFQFDLISDEDEVLCKIFDVMKMKSMYGRKYLGVDRSTFVIQDGKVIKEWRNVKVTGHVKEVLEFVQAL
jgi:thioredoxin-dependent peroxiredoxin